MAPPPRKKKASPNAHDAHGMTLAHLICQQGKEAKKNGKQPEEQQKQTSEKPKKSLETQ